MLTQYPELADLLGVEQAGAIPTAETDERPHSVQPIKQAGIPETMSEPELAVLFGIASSHVRTLCRDGVMVRVGRGRFDVRQSLQNYIARLRPGAVKGGPQTDELKAEKLRLARQQADKLEIANAAARGDMVRAADVERAWANVLRDVRSTMLAVPSRVGSKLAHLTAHDVAEIESEIRAALEGLADGN